jgi:hypothetical protein
MLVSALTLVALFFVAESRIRSFGHRPDVADSQVLWAIHRDRVGNDASDIVIAGSSHTQLGIMPDVLSEQMDGRRVVQLAINGKAPRFVLRDLAADPEFTGTIVCDMSPHWMQPPPPENSDEPYVRMYHHIREHPWQSIDRRLNVMIKAWMQSKLAVLETTSRPLKRLIFPQAGRSRHVTMRRDRYRPGRYRQDLTEEQRQALFDSIRRKQQRSKPTVLDKQTFDRQAVSFLSPIVKQLQAKGSRLILLRMPVSHMGLASLSRHPREDYWDRLSQLTGVETLHFQDYPELSGFECGDHCDHLDASDAPAFTKGLAEVLKEHYGLHQTRFNDN